MQITNVPKVNHHFKNIRENLLLANRYGYYPQEPAVAPGMRVTVEGEYDYYTVTGERCHAGDVIFEKEIDTRHCQKRFRKDPEFFSIRRPATGLQWCLSYCDPLCGGLLGERQPVYFSFGSWNYRQGRKDNCMFYKSLSCNTCSGSDISVYSANNQLIGTGSTGKDGMATICLY